MVVGAVTVGSVNNWLLESVTTFPGWLGWLLVGTGAGGSTVMMVPPVLMVDGAVTVGRVNTSLFGSVTTDG
jgi:hypothetical protein